MHPGASSYCASYKKDHRKSIQLHPCRATSSLLRNPSTFSIPYNFFNGQPFPLAYKPFRLQATDNRTFCAFAEVCQSEIRTFFIKRSAYPGAVPKVFLQNSSPDKKRCHEKGESSCTTESHSSAASAPTLKAAKPRPALQ